MDPSFIRALREIISTALARSPAGALAITAGEARLTRRLSAAAGARRLRRWLREGDAWHAAAAGTGGAVG